MRVTPIFSTWSWVSTFSLIHPAERLAFHQLAQQFHDREHQAREAALDRFRIPVDTPPAAVAGSGWSRSRIVPPASRSHAPRPN